jgi:hypothetical protein
VSEGARPDVSEGARPDVSEQPQLDQVVDADRALDVEAVADGPRDPLLSRAEGIGDLPLDERPGAFDGLNRALVAELQALEEA